MKVTINGATIVYTSVSPENTPTIVTLHGGRAIGDHSSDLKHFGPLADEYHLFCYDQRGCGRSSLTPPFSIAQLVEDLEGLRQHFNLGKIVLAGGSFGGMVALSYAVKYGEHLSALILRGTAASWHHEEAAIERARQWLEQNPSPHVSPELCRRIFSADVSSDLELALIVYAIQPLYWHSRRLTPEELLDRVKTGYYHAAAHREFFREKESYDVRSRLSTIPVPTLVTVGRHDWITPVECAEEIAGAIPQAELAVFEESGHSPQIEENERFIATVRRFLHRHGLKGSQRDVKGA